MSENHEYLSQGGDWAQIVDEAAERGDETVVVNFGPSHPSTHGVMRLIIELDGESVSDLRVGVGFLHTGIEKNMEFRTWTQGVTFMTRCNYVANFFNELVYCLAVENDPEHVPGLALLKVHMRVDRNNAGYVGKGVDIAVPGPGDVFLARISQSNLEANAPVMCHRQQVVHDVHLAPGHVGIVYAGQA